MSSEASEPRESFAFALGALTSSIRSMEATFDRAHGENSKRFEGIEIELRNVKHDGRNHQQVAVGQFDRLDRDVVVMKKQIEALQKPVHEMVALRTRIGAVGALLLSIGGVLWMFAEPVYRIAADHVLGLFYPSRH